MFKDRKNEKRLCLFLKEKKSFFVSEKFIKSAIFSVSAGVIIIFLVSIFTGCSSTKKPYQLITTYQAVEHLNPDIEGNAAPLVVVIYQLKSPAKFQEAEFFSLYTNASKVLGKNLLDKKEIEIQPNQSLTDTQNICSEATHLGVIAGYREIDNAKWKTIFKVSEGKDIKMKLVLGMTGINLDSNKKSKE